MRCVTNARSQRVRNAFVTLYVVRYERAFVTRSIARELCLRLPEGGMCLGYIEERCVPVDFENI